MNYSTKDNLYGLEYYKNHYSKLFKKKELPKINLLSGNKGYGKFSLVCNLIDSFRNDKIDYSDKSCILKGVYVLEGDLKISIDQIRSLKEFLNKSLLTGNFRYVILNDIERFNTNSSNALLKILEEPNSNTYFFLINNKQKKLLDTIRSRCIETKIQMSEKTRKNVIKLLQKINNYDNNQVLDYNTPYLSPGYYVLFSKLFKENKISNGDDFKLKLIKLLNLFKKNKDHNIMLAIKFLTELHFFNLTLNNKNIIYQLNKKKIVLLNKLNDFIKYNLSINFILSEILE